MIIDSINNASLYDGIGKGLQAAFAYLLKTDFAKIVPGRHDLDGNNLFALVQHYQTKPSEQGLWEAHRRYVDLQYVAEGVETMGYAPLGSLRMTKAYAPSDDFALFEGKGDFITVRAGMFVVFFPEDAHMPSLAAAAPAPVVKVVVKVAVA